MILYQHTDGRYGIAPTPEAADFARGDPAWHRIGPVDVAPKMVMLTAQEVNAEFRRGYTGSNCTSLAQSAFRAGATFGQLAFASKNGQPVEKG